MHCNNLVVALVDDNKAPFREHFAEKTGCSPAARAIEEILGRKSTVFMPFDTEFKLLIKNQNSCRILIDISIDGAKVSGDGVICSPNSSNYIERSVDVAHKFKFVPVDHEDVSDPTNPENGNVVITIWKEKQYVYTDNIWWKADNKWPGIYEPAQWQQQPYLSTCSTCPSTLTKSVMRGAAGAVIDGSDSSQQFTSSHWNGNDGSPTKFIFNIRGTNVNSIEQKELAELDRLMKKYKV